MRASRSRGVVVAALFFGAVILFAHPAFCADSPESTDPAALAKASQNPVANLISVPFENNATFNNTDDDIFIYNLNIKPVIPTGIAADWNLINRAIIPVNYMESGAHVQGVKLGSQFGLGDIIYQGFISPKNPGKFIWGVGPQLNLPTGSSRFTADQWSLGPAVVGLTMPGNWVVGAVVSNVWNVGSGYDEARDVNEMTAQYFINYNMAGGWFFSSAPTMTANWKNDSGDQWTVPVGGGGGRVFKIGDQHLSMKLSAYYNVEAPDGNDDAWNLQFMCIFLFPEGK